jgi:outer membrane protein OmpA-like peptidoglycan-associated protein
MARHANRIVAAAAALAFSTGCATMGKDTAIGAGIGTLAGAGVGALAGGKKGALIGAGVGALAGGSVGLYLDKQRKDLEKVAEVRKTENGLVVQMAGDILFDTNSAILKPAAVDEVTKVGDIVAKYSDDRVRIEGHTDSTGPASVNEQLSLRRADAVKQVLLSRGVQEKQMLVLGLGETRPVAENGDAAGRARNRRVELHIDVPNPT